MLKTEVEAMVGKEISFLDFQLLEKVYMLDVFDTKQEVTDFFKKYGIEPFEKMSKLVEKIPFRKHKTGEQIIDWLFSSYYQNNLPLRIIFTSGLVMEFKNPSSFINAQQLILTLKLDKNYNVLNTSNIDYNTVVIEGGMWH